MGKICCWRPTYDDSDRCIWHTENDKSTPELAEYSPKSGERLDGALLRGLDFRGVKWLASVVLIGADLSNTNASNADLSGADLRNSRLKGLIASDADLRRSNLERANCTESDLRGADLRWARLDGVTFSESQITEQTALGQQVIYEKEMKESADQNARQRLVETAIQTYGKLEELSQANSLNAQASRYYRKSKDVRRRYNWQESNYASGVAAEASRWFTGYGNRPWRVIATSVFVMILSAVIYPLVGGLHRTASGPTILDSANTSSGTVGHLGVLLVRNVYFSIVTFTTLGYGNIEPNTAIGRYVAGAEALIGTVLLALLVGVLTRSTWLR